MSYLDADFARVSPVSVPTQAPPCCRPTLVCSILQLNQTIIFGGCCRWKGWVDVVDPGRSWVSPTNGKRPHPPQPAPLTFCISNIFVLECFSPSQFIPNWKCFTLRLLSSRKSILWPKGGWISSSTWDGRWWCRHFFFIIISILPIFDLWWCFEAFETRKSWSG